MIVSSGRAWRASVVFMRAACPMAVIAAFIIAYFSWANGSYGMMAIDMFCAGVSTVLAWINWRWFSL